MYLYFALGILFLSVVFYQDKIWNLYKEIYLRTLINKLDNSNNLDIYNQEHKYRQLLEFVDRGYIGGGVLYRGKNDLNYGKKCANTLSITYKVLYLSTPDIEKMNLYYEGCFNKWFNSVWLWWDSEMPRKILKDSGLIIIFDNYDSMFEIYSYNDRNSWTTTLAVVQSCNLHLFKPIFIVSDVKYANEILQYNGRTKFANLYSNKSIFFSKEIH